MVNNNTIDLNYLEFTFDGNQQVINKILEKFIDSTPDLNNQLINGISNSSWIEVITLAHKIRSSYQTVGAKKIAKILTKIEQESIRKNKNTIKSLAQEFLVLSESVLEEVSLTIEANG